MHGRVGQLVELLQLKIGEPGVGKSVLREHIEQLNKNRETTVVSRSRTVQIDKFIWQLTESVKLETSEHNDETALLENGQLINNDRKWQSEIT